MMRSFAHTAAGAYRAALADGRRAGARDLFVRFIVSYLLKRQTVFARSCKARGHYYVLYTKGAGISTLFMAAPRFLRFCSRLSYPRARCERPRTSLSPSASKPAVIRAAALRRFGTQHRAMKMGYARTRAVFPESAISAPELLQLRHMQKAPFKHSFLKHALPFARRTAAIRIACASVGKPDRARS